MMGKKRTRQKRSLPQRKVLKKTTLADSGIVQKIQIQSTKDNSPKKDEGIFNVTTIKKWWRNVIRENGKIVRRFVKSAVTCFLMWAMNVITHSLDINITFLITLMVGHETISF